MSAGRVVVVGAGVAGLCCAYYLRRRDFDVTVIESNRVGSGASLPTAAGSAPRRRARCPSRGSRSTACARSSTATRRCTSSRAELAAPRAVAPALPDALQRARLTGRRRGDRAARPRRVRPDRRDGRRRRRVRAAPSGHAGTPRATPRPPAASSRSSRRCASSATSCRRRSSTGAELHEIEPALAAAVDAGFVVHQHWHVRPDTFTAGLAAALRRMGVEIVEGAEVVDFVREGRKLTHVRTAAGDVCRRHAGARGRRLDDGRWPHSVGISLPMEPGKGYSFSVSRRWCRATRCSWPTCTSGARRRRSHADRRDDGVQRLNSRLDRRRIDSIVGGRERSFQPFVTRRDRGRLGRDAAHHRRWAAGARSRRRAREHLHRDRVCHAGRDARAHRRAARSPR